MSKPWQVNISYDIVYEKVNIIISAITESGKSLPYMLIFLILISAIVFVVSFTIILMSD